MKKPTPAQARQRQLAWVMFVASGAAANLAHAARLGWSLTTSEIEEIERVADRLALLSDGAYRGMSKEPAPPAPVLRPRVVRISGDGHIPFGAFVTATRTHTGKT